MSEQPPSYPPAPPPPPPSGGSPAGGSPFGSDDAKGFFGALFDFSFTSFVTPKIVKIVYVVGTVLITLGFVFFLITAFSESAGFGVIVLIVGPIVSIIYLAFFRMILEMYYAIVRLSEDVHHGRGRL